MNIRPIQPLPDQTIAERLDEIERVLPIETAIPVAFAYNAETGALTWRPRPRAHFPNDRAWNAWNARYAGKPAGCPINGRVRVRLFSTHLYAHRIAWFIYYGEWPDVIDHIDGDALNNRITNLRSVAQHENMKNQVRRKNNTSGTMGVLLDPDGKWRATIFANGTRHGLGRYATKEEAINARVAGELAFGFHENHGREAMRLDENAMKFDPHVPYRREMVREFLRMTEPEKKP